MEKTFESMKDILNKKLEKELSPVETPETLEDKKSYSRRVKMAVGFVAGVSDFRKMHNLPGPTMKDIPEVIKKYLPANFLD